MSLDDSELSTRHSELGTPFRHSLPVSDAIFGLPVYVTSAGWERVLPGANYPLADTGLNGFKWEDGRILPEFCLAWVEEGKGYLETKAGRQEIPPRRAFLFRPGEWHRHRPLAATGWVILWIHFNGELPHQWLQDGSFELSGHLPELVSPELFRSQLTRLIHAAHHTAATNSPLLSWQAAGLLTHLVKQGGERRGTTGRSSDESVNRAVEFIWNHSHAFVDVAEVVAQAGLSRRSLERRFSNAMQRSVLAEIQLCRLGRAKRLLTETRVPVKQVVHRAGLRSHQQLCLLFQAHEGMSPTAYREQATPPGAEHAESW
ncbi:MAG: AraC family transcriptional regulator [Verrucomicrobia bacterium]|nr:AraC family transcriptional regulator [Verrucomicrobiota bacterium]